MKLFPYYACTCHGRKSLSRVPPNPARVTRDLYESRYSSVIAKARSLRRYISGAKKKYVRIRRRRDGGGFFLTMEVGKRTLRLDSLSGYSSAERSVRLAIRIFWRAGSSGMCIKTLKCIPTSGPPLDTHEYRALKILDVREAESAKISVGKSVSQRHGDYSDMRGARYTNLRSR